MSRAVAILALLVAVTLSGCTAEETPKSEQETTGPVVINDPGDYSYLQNRSTGAHLHDYWDGLDTLVVVDDTLHGSIYVVSERHDIAAFRPEAGQTVPLGTGHVTVAVDWQDLLPGHYGVVELWVKTAAMDRPEFVSEVTRGAVVEVPATNDDNDLPHQVLSGWMFVVKVRPAAADGSAGPIVFDGEVTMVVEAHRGLEIPLFPAHPDHWGDEARLTLLQEDREVAFHMDVGGGNACLSPCLTPIAPDAGAIVPPETDHVLLEVTYSDGTIPRLRFEYHAADTWDWTPLEPVESDGNTERYRIDIQGPMPDGPYAKQSLWAVRPYTTLRYAGMHPEVQDSLFTGGHTVEMVAVRAP